MQQLPLLVETGMLRPAYRRPQQLLAALLLLLLQSSPLAHASSGSWQDLPGQTLHGAVRRHSFRPLLMVQTLINVFGSQMSAGQR